MSGPYPDDLRAAVDAYLTALRFPARAPAVGGLEEAMRYSLLAGGKRIRPVLALATARALGLDQRAAMPLAAAIELIHTYSLIHDDLPAMDDDDLRRGRPTCHVAFGEDVAILAGDALYAEAFKHLLTAGLAAGVPAENLLVAAAELADATGVDGMVGGQFLDVTADKALAAAESGAGDPVGFDAAASPADDVAPGPETPLPAAAPGSGGPAGPTVAVPVAPVVTAEDLRVLHELKTGRLIGASVGCVLAIAGVDDDRAAALRGFAADLGVLFQVVDDILDVTGTDLDLGKPQGSDERHGKRTYVTEYGLDGARSMATELHDAASTALRSAVPSTGAEDLHTLTAFIHTRTN
ncbi:polyprenyl synthetase family protein [Patulibacter sp.]|uniref:polyprenyl synthetase family protein n=1 Tax=Patulibacter sp. TaxID=1912859 RepID=UPI0027259EDE|nr:polyprenyl synthetase family protein [Patulibacter sp.]MDO9408230.1 polyprenyl synthetase family protein [Patulibacter sp.]